MAVTWNATFKDDPANADSPSEGAANIRETREAIQERIKNEHGNIDNTAVGADGTASKDWWHREGSGLAYYSDASPTNRPDGTTALGTNDKGRLFISDSGNYRPYVYTGSAWTSVGVAGTALDNVASASSSITTFKCAVYSIGGWNMDTTANKDIAHGLGNNFSLAFQVGAVIINDARTYSYMIGGHYTPLNDEDAAIYRMSQGTVRLWRKASGNFDAATYASTGVNRGWVMIWYKDS